MALPYAKIILARLSEELKPRGFRRNAHTFIKPVNDCYQLVNLHMNSCIVNERRDFSVNVGVYSTRLEPLEKDAMRLKLWEMHWDASLSEFSSIGLKKWWPGVWSDELAIAAAADMTSLLPLSLEAMDLISSYEAIIRIPRGPGSTSDDPPGGSFKWHIIDVARKYEGLSPSKPPEPYSGWRNSWHQRHFPDVEGV